MILYLDLETRSRVPIDYGVYRYAVGAEILLCNLAQDDGEVEKYEWSDEVRTYLIELLHDCERAGSHNDEFDFSILELCAGIIFPLERRFCTMAQARMHGLPGGLDRLCELLKIPADEAKRKDSKKLIRLFCVPNKEGGWNTKETHPAEWARFIDYGGGDVTAMRACHKLLPKWNLEIERPTWILDHEINARGMAIDTEFAQAAVDLMSAGKTEGDAAITEASTGYVTAGTQRDRLLEHILLEHGVSLPDLTASTIERRLQDNELSESVKELLRLRLEASKTSTSKYAALLNCVSGDGRLRGSMVYCGAGRTGRWSGTKFQPHNLPRQKESRRADIEFNTRAITAHCPEALDDTLSRCASEAIRGVVIAPPGRKLLVADYSSIEGRVVAWLADERWKLEAFRDNDRGAGPGLYELAYGRAFGIATDDVTQSQRQVGKVMELMLGFGGGVGAFVTGSETYRVNLAEMAEACWPLVPADVKIEAQLFWSKTENTFDLTWEEFTACDALKRMWRRDNPKIASLWDDVEAAFRFAMVGEEVTVGRLKFDKVQNWVRMQLPSGRYLCYPSVKVGKVEKKKSDDDTLSFLGIDPYTHQWGRIITWGGTLVENATQAVARDCLAYSLRTAKLKGLPIVLHVHDEPVAEVDESRTVAELESCMHYVPWASGLPLATHGFETTRYRKE